MTRKQDLQNTVLDLSHKVVKSFYSRRTETILPLLDEQFLWIGSRSFQWTEGAAAFGQLKRGEGESTSVPDIGNEYYNILSSDGKSWVVCGRFTVSLRVDADVICRLLIRVTLVWSQKGERFSLLHLHSSCAKDYPPTGNSSQETRSFCQYLHENLHENAVSRDMTPETSIRLSLRDEAGHLHYLTSSEILYVKASNQWCHIVTAFDQFLSFGSLTSFEEKLPGFLRIHRSYLVNSQAIEKLRFNRVYLWNHEELPVSKKRYQEIKKVFKPSPPPESLTPPILF